MYIRRAVGSRQIFSSSKRDRNCTSWKLGVKTRGMGTSGTDITLAFYYTRATLPNTHTLTAIYYAMPSLVR